MGPKPADSHWAADPATDGGWRRHWSAGRGKRWRPEVAWRLAEASCLLTRAFTCAGTTLAGRPWPEGALYSSGLPAWAHASMARARAAFMVWWCVCKLDDGKVLKLLAT